MAVGVPLTAPQLLGVIAFNMVAFAVPASGPGGATNRVLREWVFDTVTTDYNLELADVNRDGNWQIMGIKGDI